MSKPVWKPKPGVAPEVRSYLSKIGSKGGKNGSLKDKSLAGKSKSLKKAEASRKSLIHARQVKLEKYQARLDGLGHGSEAKK